MDTEKANEFKEVSPSAASDDNSDSIYAALFESSYMKIESTYHGVDFPEENIYECLNIALNFYDADRAFIMELDEELGASQVLYFKARPDGILTPLDYNDGMLTGNLFTDIVIRDQSFQFISDDLKDSHPAEYCWLRDRNIFNTVAVPFKTRTGLVAFFGVNNLRRFWNKTSFLTLCTKSLNNEIRHINMIQLISAAKHKSPELSDEDVVFKLFGGFEINTNIGSLDFNDFSSLQCSRFLLYLLKNRNRTIPVRELAEVLWPDQLIDNPYNMVKGVAFRVRKILDNICPLKLVIAKSGSYAINDKLTLVLDTDVLDQLIDRVHSSNMPLIEKQQLYERALRVYKGDMLPNYESEIWLLGWIGYYQIKYLELLKEYLALLKDTEQYSKIFEVVSNVQTVGYDDGEVYEALVDALVRQNKLDLAKSYYTRVEKFLSPEKRRHFMDTWKDYKKNCS